ncbi:Peroxiredoxin Q, chloroplastic, partial [Cucurbita argyrosperma subsp. argyrosperma]
MASLAHPTPSLPSLLPSLSPKTPSAIKLPFPSRSSPSQFLGAQISHHISLSSVPSSSSFRFTVSSKVSKGQAPPAFNLKDQDGRNVSLSKFKGKPVVVYFYPADETPGCTKQACAFRDSYEKFKKAGAQDGSLTFRAEQNTRDSYEKFKKAGAQVVGISGDDSSSHKAFAKKYRLPFTLLSDEGNKVRKEWGVPSDLFGALPGRQTYVLDKNGIVQLVYNNQFQPEKHIDETLKLLQTL